jgi:alcohol dehydrogenase
MKALVFHGPGDIRWDEVPDPVVVEATDAVVQVDTTTICGTDLHILKGDVPAVTPGRILGHEAVGTVVAVGSAVRTVEVGGRVIVSCISACGVCASCRAGIPSHCLAAEGKPGIGWVLGHLINGTQAELVRVPFADVSLHALPPDVEDEQAVLLSDILPTGFEIGVQSGRIRPGSAVAVVGAGPIGLAVVATAGLYGAADIIAIDTDAHRLSLALQVGANVAVNPAKGDWLAEVLDATGGQGVDTAIEAVGTPRSLQMCTEMVRAGGTVANIGVHGKPVELNLQDLWIQNIAITTGLVNTTSIDMLLHLVARHRLPLDSFVTHHFGLADALAAYETFGDAAKHHAVKVALKR